ncbi:Latrophilin-3, partial [Exaiptasia diaphana]
MLVAFGLAEAVGKSAQSNSSCWVSTFNQPNTSILFTWSSANHGGLYAVRFWPLYSNHSVASKTVNQSSFLATRLEPFTVYRFDIREESSNSRICTITIRTKTGKHKNGLNTKRFNFTTVYVEWIQIKRLGFYTTYRAFIEWGSDDSRYVGLVYDGPNTYTWVVKDYIPLNYSFHVNFEFKSYKENCKSVHSKGITWPGTKIGEVASSRCPHGAYGNATRKCKKGEKFAVWEEPNYSDCVSMDIASIHDSISKGHSDPVKNARKLVQATKANRHHRYSGEDIKLIVSSLDILATEKTIHQVKSAGNHTNKDANDLAVSVLNVSNGILDEEALASWKQMPKTSAISLANKVIQSLDKIAVFLVSNSDKHDVTVSTDNVAISVRAVPRDETDTGQWIFSTDGMRDGHSSSVYVPGPVIGRQQTAHGIVANDTTVVVVRL